MSKAESGVLVVSLALRPMSIKQPLSTFETHQGSQQTVTESSEGV